MTQQKKIKCEEKESNVSKGKMRIKIDLTSEEEQLILEQMIGEIAQMMRSERNSWTK